jgi:amino acid adenylation domain-containing protein
MRNGEAVQVVLKEVDVPLHFTDLSSEVNVEQREQRLKALLIEEGRKTFSLDHAPLIRFHLFRLTPELHVVFYNVHHIVADQWSLDTLKRDLSRLYADALHVEAAVLPVMPIQYLDVAVRERSEETRQLYERQLDYWRTRLQGVPTLLELPFSGPRPPEQGFAGNTLTLSMDPGLTRQLRQYAARSNTSLYLLMLQVFSVLLYRYTGQPDLCIGTPITGRKRRDEENVIGLFVNMLPLRVTVDPAEPFNDFVKRSVNAVLSDFEHSDLPFQKLVSELHPQRSSSHSPLFQITFALNAKGAVTEEEQQETYIGISKYDLTLQISEQANTLDAHFEYRTDLFAPADMERFAHHFVRLATSVVEGGETAVGSLNLLTSKDVALYEQWNATEMNFDRSQTLVSLFEQQAIATPGQAALCCAGTMMTFAELHAQVLRLAQALSEHGAGAGSFVAICQDRTPELIISILAVHKTGAAYLPLDPKYPEDRLVYMLEDSGALLIVAHRNALTEKLTSICTTVHVVSPTEEPIVAHRNDGRDASPDDAAYLIYTSGSTGKPKGVVVEHRNAVALIAWAKSLFQPKSLRGMLASTSVCFDLSIFEIFLPLSTGNVIVLVNDLLELPKSPHAERVTLVNTVPSAMQALLQAGLPSSVQTVCMAGEFLPTELVDKVYAGGAEQVFDLYGPTETTTYSTFTLREPGASATIGGPISNTRVYLLDEYKMLVPPGASGELYIGGEGVTRGYLNRSELTSERFFLLPEIEPQGRLYRTGDMARQLADGRLVYQGRRDGQIKLRGHRIELGEIESALREISGAGQAVVVVQKRGAGDALVAFLVAAPDTNIDISQCMAELRKRLPGYMIPSEIMLRAELPLTPNGKIDRKALSAVVEAPAAHGIELPQDLLEQWLANIWSERLGKQSIARDAHFFDDLGGHSLVAFEIFAAIEKRLGVAMMLATLFQAPTIELLARAVRRLRWKEPKYIQFVSAGAGGAVIYLVGKISPSSITGRREIRIMSNSDQALTLDASELEREIAVYEAARPALVLMAQRSAEEFTRKLATALGQSGFDKIEVEIVG